MPRAAAMSTPALAARVGAVPRPRVRPLPEVLAAHPAPAAAREPDPGDDLGDLDAMAGAARPAARSLLGALAEVLDGHRPPGHLQALCADHVYPTVARRAPARPRDARTTVRGVRVCAVSAAAAEVSAVLHTDERVRAVAARLERAGRAWRLTALELG